MTNRFLKEKENVRRLSSAKRNSDSNYSDLGYNDFLQDQLEEESQFTPIDEERKARNLRRLKNFERGVKIAELGFAMHGGKVGDLGSLALGSAGSLAGDVEDGNTVGHGLRRIGSNIAGSQLARKLQSKKNLSLFKSQALGGAAATALQGGSLKDIAKSAWSWAILSIAFKGLWTGVGFLPSIIYLNIHNFFNKIGFNKTFGDMFLMQKLGLFFANFMLGLALFLILIIILVYYQYTQLNFFEKIGVVSSGWSLVKTFIINIFK